MSKTKQYRLDVIEFTVPDEKLSILFHCDTIFCFEYKILPLNRIRIRTLFSLN